VAAGAAVLELEGVDAFYGRIQALRGVTFHIDAGEIVALIGSNGAGKTTTLRTISGLMHPSKGSIRLEGADISRTPAHEIVRRGVCHAPEGRRVFARMQVVDNLQMGAYARNDGDIGADLDRVYKLFPRLRERATQLAGTLSGGEQQMLAIGRALMARPKVLMLDEPSLGLAPILVELIFTIIKDINASGVPILLVEQNAHKALEVANRGYVLETGSIATEGTGAQLLRSPEVQKAYLGI
jgi:branched-chain amino acid transport system ATP-binding protein